MAERDSFEAVDVDHRYRADNERWRPIIPDHAEDNGGGPPIISRAEQILFDALRLITTTCEIDSVSESLYADMDRCAAVMEAWRHRRVPCT